MTLDQFQSICVGFNLSPTASGQEFGVEMLKARVTAHYSHGVASVFCIKDDYNTQFAQANIGTEIELKEAITKAKEIGGSDESD